MLSRNSSHFVRRKILCGGKSAMRGDDSLLQIECFQIRRLLAHKGGNERYGKIITFLTNDEIAIKRAISKDFFQSHQYPPST